MKDIRSDIFREATERAEEESVINWKVCTRSVLSQSTLNCIPIPERTVRTKDLRNRKMFKEREDTG